jgi:hypothetical protein
MGPETELQSIAKTLFKQSKRSLGRKIPQLETEPSELAYVVTPYSKQFDFPLELHDRYMQAVRACALLCRGYVIYSPIVMHHPLAVEMKLPTDALYWWPRNKRIIDLCDVVIVVTFDGVSTSKGCRQEIEYARSIQRKLWFVTPHELGIKE